MKVKCVFSEAIVPRPNSSKVNNNEFYVVDLARSGLCHKSSCPGEFENIRRAKEFCRYFLEKANSER